MCNPGISTEFDEYDYRLSVHLAWQPVTNEGIARFHCENPTGPLVFICTRAVSKLVNVMACLSRSSNISILAERFRLAGPAEFVAGPSLCD